MIDIETIKTIATEDWEINWPSKTVLELITRLEAAESKQILGASARHFKQMEAAESQQVAQELVIQQLRDALSELALAVAKIATEYEREACAKLCETAEVPIDIDVWMGTKKALTAATAIGLATAIRKRSHA